MHDPELNRNLEETRELAQRWTQFHDFFNMAKSSDSAITPDAERKFLELKTRIALLHEAFMSTVQHDKSIAQNVIGTVSACVMLKYIRGMNPTEQQKLEYDWNEAYMLMNETVAQTEERVEELASVSEMAHRMQRIQSAIKQRVRLILSSTWMKIAAVAAVLLFILVVLPLLGILDYRFVKRTVPAVTGLYNTVANTLRGPLPGLPYADFEEIELTNPGMGAVMAVDQDLVNAMNRGTFARQLPTLGFAVVDVDRATELVNSAQYRGIIFSDANLNRVFVHELIFPETSDAKDFVQLWTESVARLQDPETRERVQQEVSMGRQANHVVLLEAGIPQAAHDFLTQRWGFSDKQIIGAASEIAGGAGA